MTVPRALRPRAPRADAMTGAELSVQRAARLARSRTAAPEPDAKARTAARLALRREADAVLPEPDPVPAPAAPEPDGEADALLTEARRAVAWLGQSHDATPGEVALALAVAVGLDVMAEVLALVAPPETTEAAPPAAEPALDVSPAVLTAVRELAAAHPDGHVTRADVETAIGCSRASAARHLAALVRAGALVPVGAGRSARYQITPCDRPPLSSPEREELTDSVAELAPNRLSETRRDD